MNSPALSSGDVSLTAPFTPVKVWWYKKLATFLFERIHLYTAGRIARRCNLLSTKSATCLLVYYLISILNALCDGIGMVLLVDLVIGRLDSATQSPIINAITRILNQMSINPSYTTFYFILIGLFLLRLVLTYSYMAMGGVFEATLRRRIQERCFTNILQGDWETLRSLRVGECVGAISEASNDVANFFVAIIRALYSLMAVIVLVTIALFVSFNISLLFASVGIPVLLILRYMFNAQARLAENLVNERQGFYMNITERLNGLFQIKVEGNVPHHIHQGLRNQAKLTQIEVKWWHFRAGINAFNLLLPAIILFLSYAWSHWKGQSLSLMMNLMAGVGIVGARALTQINELNANIGNITRFSGSVLPVYRFFLIKPETVKKSTPEKIGRLELKNVSYFYNQNTGIQGVTLQTSIRFPLIIMGPSGGGKTTLANLMACVYQPAKGTVHYIGISEKTYDSSTHRPQVGYVTQDIILFHGTVKDNLTASWEKSVDDLFLWHCLQQAGADQFVHNMGGMTAMISESGKSLSGGERRRLGIARALVRNPDILILDEVTAGLDEARKQGLIKTIQHLSTSLIVVVITHDTDLANTSGFTLFKLVPQKILEQPTC